MKSRVYETVGRPSVSPSVSLSVRSVVLPRHAAAAGLLLWRRRAGDIDGHRRPPGKREQSHVYSRRIRLNAGLFCFFYRATLCYAVYAVVVCPSVRPSVSHKPALYVSKRLDKSSRFWHGGFFH